MKNTAYEQYVNSIKQYVKNDNSKNLMEFVCQTCNKKFNIGSNRIDIKSQMTGMYCSLVCASKYLEGLTEHTVQEISDKVEKFIELSIYDTWCKNIKEKNKNYKELVDIAETMANNGSGDRMKAHIATTGIVKGGVKGFSAGYK